MSDAYKNAGVDVEAGYESVELIKESVKRTNIQGVMGGLGGFGGLFDMTQTGLKEPVLVSGTDGVGTKIKLAFIMDKHGTIGQDCVAMCVNDIICSGAKPLFFLDYLAVGKNQPAKVAEIVGGVAHGCELAGCALIGGETAEHPGLMPEDEYDLAGFAVGAVEKSKMLNHGNVTAGQTLIALKSSGVHSNGFSLIRRIFGIDEPSGKNHLLEYSEDLSCTLGEALLEPTYIYVRQVLELLETVNISAISHITGGGFYENIPRMLPKGLTANIHTKNIQTPPIFDIIQRYGELTDEDMFGTFNMGVGMVLATSEPDAALRVLGDSAYVLGEVEKGAKGVQMI